MRLDRKLLLIAPAIVLVLVVAGMIYAAVQMNALAGVSSTLETRRTFIAAVARGEKPLEQRQALNIIDAQFNAEGRRSVALMATRDLLVLLSAIGGVSIGVLAIGIRGVPREHWPRFPLGRSEQA